MGESAGRWLAGARDVLDRIERIGGALLEEVEVAEMSPWIDLRLPPKEVKLPAVEAQEHRRCAAVPAPARRRSESARRDPWRGTGV